MTRVDLIEEQVKELNSDELRSFRNWFVEFDPALWDQQIEGDAKTSKMRSLGERALRHADYDSLVS
jgi:hypothetical protein